jgi:hypothetical protein
MNGGVVSLMGITLNESQPRKLCSIRYTPVTPSGEKMSDIDRAALVISDYRRGCTGESRGF